MRYKNNILELIKEHSALFDSFKHVYLFGSTMYPNIDHNDIDILIIYAKYSDEIEDMVNVISDELEKASGLLVDLTVLSIEEERETAFIKKIEPHYFKIK